MSASPIDSVIAQASLDARLAVLEMALSVYVGEPCQVCAVEMTREAVDTAVWAPGATGRLAHAECWAGLPEHRREAWKDAVRDGEVSQ